MAKILSSKDIEPRREIVEPAKSKAITKLLQDKHESDERVIADRKERESHIAPDGDTNIMLDKSLAQRGRALMCEEVVRRVKLANPNIHFEVSNNCPTHGGFYIVENRPDPVTNIAPWKRFICGIPMGEVWEFHRPLVVEEEIPDVDNPTMVKSVKVEGQVPGWRQILLRLVYDGVIKPADCETYFNVSRGRSSANWQKAQIN